MSVNVRSALVWHRATVADGLHGRRVLKFADPSACTRCARGEGCGAAHLSRLFGGGSGTVLPLPPGRDFQPGETVRVGIEERWLLQAAVLTYLLPAVAFVGGALAAHALTPGHDVAALAAGLAVAAVVLVAMKSRLTRVSNPRMVVQRPAADPLGALESGDDGAHVGCQSEFTVHPADSGARIRRNPR